LNYSKTPSKQKKDRKIPFNNSNLLRQIRLKKKTSRSSIDQEWKEAINVFLVHYIFFWIYIIGYIISNFNHNGTYLELANAILMGIDMGLLNYFLLYINLGVDTFGALALAWNVALLYSGIAYGPRYQAIFLKTVLLTVIIGNSIFIILFLPSTLLITISSGKISTLLTLPLILSFLTVILIIYAFVVSIPSFIIILLFLSKKTNAQLSPYKETVPGYLIVPPYISTKVSLNLEKDPGQYCPYRFKDRSGCSFLGYEVTDKYPLICDQKETWSHCFVYKYITNKKQERRLES